MQPGELIVTRMKGGASIGRYVGVDPVPAKSRGQQVRVSVERNRQARLPLDRVILATGITASEDEEVEEFRDRCEALAAEIDLTDVWDLVRDEAAPSSLDDLVLLYWGPPVGPAHRVAMLLHLERTSLYFVGDEQGYRPRTQDSVRETLARREREAENARESESLAVHLSQGRLPPQPSRYQRGLLEHLHGYAVHGDNYTRSSTAQALLAKIDSGTRDYQRLSFELLVKAGIFSPDEPLELERAGIAGEFPEDVLAEAATLDLSELLAEAERRDLTGMPTVTIDDAGTTDKDDAISLELEAGASDQLPSTYRIGVHIADVALIPVRGALDNEADRRMATLYMPDRKVPMLPPEVSEQTGSLLAGERRATLSLLARITESGSVVGWEVTPSVIRSQAALSYSEADQAIGDASHPWHHVLASLDKIARSLRQKREQAGAVALEPPEMTIRVTSGQVDVTVLPRSTPGRTVVAELMILCNSLLAEFCRAEGLPAAYRSQPAPDLSDVKSEAMPGQLHRFLVMRRLPPAYLDTVPAAHAGLGVPAYIQATSPLRRYPDLVLQRQISRFLSTGQPLYSTEEIASLAQRAEVQLRELARLEEDRRRYWFLKYLKQSLATPGKDDRGGLFDAIVLENQPRRPALLELAEYPFRIRAELPEGCAPGEVVTLRLHGVDLWRRVGQFVHTP